MYCRRLNQVYPGNLSLKLSYGKINFYFNYIFNRKLLTSLCTSQARSSNAAGAREIRRKWLSITFWRATFNQAASPCRNPNPQAKSFFAWAFFTRQVKAARRLIIFPLICFSISRPCADLKKQSNIAATYPWRWIVTTLPMRNALLANFSNALKLGGLALPTCW